MGVVEPVRGKLTFTDLQQMPDDGRRYELYDGEVFELPSPIPKHQFVGGNVLVLLHDYRRARGGLVFAAPLDIVFSELNVVQPDVVFFLEERMHLVNLYEPIRVRPDLAVEVLSPGTERNDRGRKLRMFVRYEVPEYWIVDPIADTLELLVFHEGEYLVRQTARGADVVTSPHLTGLMFPVARLFEHQ
jgi:Uma2 family endonuclease